MSSFSKLSFTIPTPTFRAKAPAGAPLPSVNQPAAGNPKVPAKPTNLNGRLGMPFYLGCIAIILTLSLAVSQRASQMVTPGMSIIHLFFHRIYH